MPGRVNSRTPKLEFVIVNIGGAGGLFPGDGPPAEELRRRDNPSVRAGWSSVRRIVFVGLVIPPIAVGCTDRGPPASSGPPTSVEPAASGSPTAHPSPPPSGTGGTGRDGGSEFVPPPEQAIPRSPHALAQVLARTNRSLRAAIGRWVAGGRPAPARPPGDVALLALYQQRIYRLLARDDRLARRTLPLMPRAMADTVAANVGAARSLFSLVGPVPPGYVLHVQRPEPPGRLLGLFREAERRFGVDWQLLAAVMLVESKFGRTRSASTAGAQGPMQFAPATWAAYGLGGDVHDPHDAVLGAANYLHASGAPGDERRALFAYNHAGAYVDAVEAYASQMRGDPLSYFAYYNWQVFVVTVDGDRRLTGPGLS